MSSARTTPRPQRWGRPLYLLRYLKRRWQQRNPKPKAQRNVAHHYDLDERLYSLFLDADRQYSCGYFEAPGQSLDDAQLAKKRHLAAKLLMQRGQRVLDIGCGWGGLALYLAEFCGARVKGITLSKEQHALAQQRAAEKQLSGQVDFQLKDYRDVSGPFDRIVSVGMFEHVGLNFYDTFFRKCADLLSRRRRFPAAFHRPFGRARHHQSLGGEIYFPGRLYPGPVGGAALYRARRTAGDRY